MANPPPSNLIEFIRIRLIDRLREGEYNIRKIANEMMINFAMKLVRNGLSDYDLHADNRSIRVRHDRYMNFYHIST